jgi:hypothetical protein
MILDLFGTPNEGVEKPGWGYQYSGTYGVGDDHCYIA